MVVSYTLSQDALRFGAFAGEGGEDVLLRSVMKDLADMHGVSEVVLWGMKVDHKVYYWFGSEYSAGELVHRALSRFLY